MNKIFFWQDLNQLPTIRQEGEWFLKEQNDRFKIYIKPDGSITSLKFNGEFWESHLNGHYQNGTHSLEIKDWYIFK